MRFFIGFDSRQDVAGNVLTHSIQSHACRPVHIAQVRQLQLHGLDTRLRHSLQSTDFSIDIVRAATWQEVPHALNHPIPS